MNTFEVIKTDKTYLMIKNAEGKLKHIETQVTYSVAPDDQAPDFEYGNAEENAAEMARFESGELLNVCLKVTVEALGEKGTDYLGQCFVQAKDVETQILNIAAEHDMKNQACIELKANILAQYEAMTKALA